jgi:hypothetical protein
MVGQRAHQVAMSKAGLHPKKAVLSLLSKTETDTAHDRAHKMP